MRKGGGESRMPLGKRIADVSPEGRLCLREPFEEILIGTLGVFADVETGKARVGTVLTRPRDLAEHAGEVVQGCRRFSSAADVASNSRLDRSSSEAKALAMWRSTVPLMARTRSPRGGPGSRETARLSEHGEDLA